jgi:peptide/nickel transport system substrate-binding protein
VTTCTYFWSPDNRTLPEEVRRAIGYAYPHRQVARAQDLVFGVTYLPGTSILPPGFPGRLDYDVLGTEPGRADPAKATALLEKAGYARGDVTLKWPYVDGDPTSAAAMDAIETALDAVGFDVEPVAVPSRVYDAWNGDPDAPLNVRAGSWCTPWPTGDAWFPPLFQSASPSNRASFDEQAVDAEIGRILSLDVVEQPTAWGALDKTLMTDYFPVVITSYKPAVMLHGSRVGGMSDDSIWGMPTWKDVYLTD